MMHTYKTERKAGTHIPPSLFNGCSQKAVDQMREKLKHRGGSIKILEERIDMLQFDDDIAILTESDEELMVVLDEIEDIPASQI